jgi:hypothetical protein
MREEERDRVARQGTEAWRRLKKEKNWNDWLKVGEALQVGREWAMNQAGTNQPQGKAYNMAFGEWLQRYKLDDMDKGDRSRLFSVMDNLPNERGGCCQGPGDQPPAGARCRACGRA